METRASVPAGWATSAWLCERASNAFTPKVTALGRLRPLGALDCATAWQVRHRNGAPTMKLNVWVLWRGCNDVKEERFRRPIARPVIPDKTNASSCLKN